MKIRALTIACEVDMTRGTDPLDAEIGKRLRALRLRRGRSQASLGEALGLTFQQIQKYERGANRISASRLQRMAEILNVPVTFFYPGFDDSGTERDSGSVGEFDFLQTGGAMRLVYAYSQINDRALRLKLLLLTEKLSSAPPGVRRHSRRGK